MNSRNIFSSRESNDDHRDRVENIPPRYFPPRYFPPHDLRRRSFVLSLDGDVRTRIEGSLKLTLLSRGNNYAGQINFIQKMSCLVLVVSGKFGKMSRSSRFVSSSTGDRPREDFDSRREEFAIVARREGRDFGSASIDRRRSTLNAGRKVLLVKVRRQRRQTRDSDSRTISAERRNGIRYEKTFEGKKDNFRLRGVISELSQNFPLDATREEKKNDATRELKKNVASLTTCKESKEWRSYVPGRKHGNFVSSPMRSLRAGLFVLGLLFGASNGTINCPSMQVLDTGGITCDVIKEIVDTHNDLRQSIAEGSVDNQPPATNMREMYWDEELASGAQDWADHCTFGHNDAKDREVARFQVGQNLAMTKSKSGRDTSAMEFTRHIHSWFQEHTVYRFRPIDSLDDLKATGHYTQVAWANSYLVGCGYSRYKTRKNIVYRLYVCHYGPSGNELDETPYKNGSSLTCPKFLRPSKKYPNLCSLKKPPKNACNSARKRMPFSLPDILKLGNRRFLTPVKHENPNGKLDRKLSQQDKKPNRDENCTRNNPIFQATIFYNIITFIL